MPVGADMGLAPHVAARVGATLGEGPFWDAARKCLWFVDIKGHMLHRFDPGTGAVRRWTGPEEPGWVIPRHDGTLVLGAKAGVHRFCAETGTFDRLHAVEPGLPGNRLNDAAVHPDGSIWFGTMDNAEETPTGGYYRLSGGMCVALDIEPMVITNGPAFSPSGDTAYFVGTLERAILAAPIGPDGLPGEATLFARLPQDMGYPDGLVVDSAGTVWVGLFGGWGARPLRA